MRILRKPGQTELWIEHNGEVFFFTSYNSKLTRSTVEPEDIDYFATTDEWDWEVINES